MDELNEAAIRRNQLESYLQAIFSPHLIATPWNDSLKVTNTDYINTQPTSMQWEINNN